MRVIAVAMLSVALVEAPLRLVPPPTAQSASAQNVQAQGTPAPVGDPQRLRDEIKAVEGLLPRLPDRGSALYMLAHHYARLGNHRKALALLKECVALNQGFNPADAPAFEALKKDPEFRELVEQVCRRYPPVHRARVAFTVQQNDLFPEGLEVDSANRVFLMSSMHHNKIVRITETGEVSDFVKEGLYDLMPVGGAH